MRERRRSSSYHVHRSQNINGLNYQRSPGAYGAQYSNNKRKTSSQESFSSSQRQDSVRSHTVPLVTMKSSVAESIVTSLRNSLRSSFSSFDGDEKNIQYGPELKYFPSRRSHGSEVTVETLRRDENIRRRSSVSALVMQDLSSYTVRPRYGRIILGVIFFAILIVIGGLFISTSGNGDDINLTLRTEENLFVNVSSSFPSQSPIINVTQHPSMDPSSETEESLAPSSDAEISFIPSSAPQMKTSNPSLEPSLSITNYPSESISHFPSNIFSDQPTNFPSYLRSEEPSLVHSQAPSTSNLYESTAAPSGNDVMRNPETAAPTPELLTQEPTLFDYASDGPTTAPSDNSSISPTNFPFDSPSSMPSSDPTSYPSFRPTTIPSMLPTERDCSSYEKLREFWEGVARDSGINHSDVSSIENRNTTIEWLSLNDNVIDICNDPYDIATERYALAFFYFTNNRFFSSFHHSQIITSNKNHCSTQANAFEKWMIRCDGYGYITNLQIYNLEDIQATIPKEITLLQRLEIFTFRNSPELIGTLPEGFFGIPSLREIDVMNTALSGNLFRSDLLEESCLRRMTILRMGSDVSYFIGRFPYSDKRLFGEPSENDFFSSVPRLKFKLNDWTATTIPHNITMMTNLIEFSCSNCNLEGGVPHLDGMTNLRRLSLWGNRLNGTIPRMTVEMTDVKLNGNNFTGYIPETVEFMLNLKVLEIGNNHLSGTIPSQIGQLNLRSLHLYNNNLSGSIPNSVASLQNAQMIYLQHNQITGTIPASLVAIPRLWLNLNNNRLTGALPDFQQTDLQMFQVGFNSLTGTIPDSLTRLNFKTAYIHLNDNNFIGTIPRNTGLTYLREFFVQENSLTGWIPNIGDWTLQWQKYHSNDFSGGASFICQYAPFHEFTTDCYLDCECCTACYEELDLPSANPTSSPTLKPKKTKGL